MSPVALSSLLAIAAAALSLVAAQSSSAQESVYPATPLYSKHYASPSDLPYKVDSDEHLVRGTQQGYNICNDTTQLQTSMCQTAFVENIGDFCLWAPPNSNTTVGQDEGEMVAWCTKRHGTRLIPNGALKGVQVLKTPDYLQFVGFIDQAQINLSHDDFGGEMDPHGADNRGNPMGGVVFSSNWTGSDIQVSDWHNFMGGNAFCFRICDPSRPNARNFCENVYDRIGCAYNDPNNAKEGVFEVCAADNADYVGIYTDSKGAVQTYHQPDEALGPITTIPYTPRIPGSSNCVTYTSSALYTDLATVSPTVSVTPSGSLSTSRKLGVSSTGSGAGVKPTNPGSISNDASVLAISGISFLAVVFSALFLA